MSNVTVLNSQAEVKERHECDVIYLDERAEPSKKEEKKVKLKKDGTPKIITHNKKKGVSSEVFELTLQDVKKILEYFQYKGMWVHYLVFALSCNLARRKADMLEMKWDMVFDPSTGKLRNTLPTMNEQKTSKFATLILNDACKDAINLFIRETGVNPSDNNYKNSMIIQPSGNYRGRPLSDSGYYKGLKRAAKDCDIECPNIGTHSARKTFGSVSVELHSSDPLVVEKVSHFFNHSSTKVTQRYIGLHREQSNELQESFGEIFQRCMSGEDEVINEGNSPIVHLDVNDLRQLLSAAYDMGIRNSGNPDHSVHTESLIKLMKMADRVQK